MEPDNDWVRPLAEHARIYVEVQGRPLSCYADAKQPAERFMEGDPREVLPAAIRYLVNHWEAILESWKS